MIISGLNIQYGGNGNNSHLKMDTPCNDFMEVLSAASKQIDKQEEGSVLGITMIREPGTNRFWGMKAKYASCSTKDNPVIYLETNYGGKTVSYNVNIKEVDPNNASRLEMFALCSYADAVGIGDKSTFGSYSTLRSFEEMSIHNGYIDSKMDELGAFDQFQNEKLNWGNMCKKVIALLYECNDLIQNKKGLSIMDMFSKQLAK